MSHELKIKVLQFLQNLPEDTSEQYNQAFAFYRQFPNKSRQAQVVYNRPMTAQSLKNLLYDLQKIATISDLELHSAPVNDESEVIQMNSDFSVMEKFKEAFNALDKGLRDSILQLWLFIDIYGDVVIEEREKLKEFFKIPIYSLELLVDDNLDFEIAEGKLSEAEMVSYAKELLVDVQFTEELSNLIAELELVPEAPTADQLEGSKDNFLDELDLKAKQIIDSNLGNDFALVDTEALPNIRKEFPFLNDADCPDVLYVVVGRRIAAHNRYAILHEKLQKANAGEVQLSEEEKTQLTLDTEAAYNDNRKLWDELEYYAKNKQILGKHVLFREDNIKKEVELMTMDEAFKLKASSSKYFHDQKKYLEKYKDNADKLAEVHQRIEDRTYKLALVNAKIGASNG